MEGEKPSAADEISGPNVPAPPTATWEEEEDRMSSASGFVELLNQMSVSQVEPRVLSSSEFLEFLRKQGPDGRFQSSRSIAAAAAADDNSKGLSNKSQIMHNKDKNHDYQSVAIDQCDITSSVDYGSRDFYRPSTNTSETPYVYKGNELDELYKSCTDTRGNELDELYKSCTDTRGNWWEGSFYY